MLSKPTPTEEKLLAAELELDLFQARVFPLAGKLNAQEACAAHILLERFFYCLDGALGVNFKQNSYTATLVLITECYREPRQKSLCATTSVKATRICLRSSICPVLSLFQSLTFRPAKLCRFWS